MYRVVKIGGTLIVVYLVAAYATGFGSLLGSAGSAGAGVVKAFQGRG